MSKKKITLLRNLLKKKNCDYYLLPRTDKFQNEFILEEDERVKWLTGFSGSSAFVIISLKQNFIFTDGRYIEQIKKEVDQRNFKILDINKLDPLSWLSKKIKSKQKIIVDSWLFTSSSFNYLKNLTRKKKIEIILSEKILIDRIWKKKKYNSNIRVFSRKKKYSGISFINKINQVKDILKKKKINNFFFSSCESISWLLNIRSNEISFNPIVLSFLLLNLNEKSYLFSKKNLILVKHFRNCLTILKFEDLKRTLIDFTIINNDIYLDPKKTPYFIENFFETIGVNVKYAKDPCVELKLIKNSTEIKGSKNSHVRDGVSICKFLHWLDISIDKKRKISEISTSKQLFNYRKKNKLFCDLSFETISGFGSNGAIVHYRVSKETNKILKKNNLYLFDSGAQYLDGTTDVTRTIYIGDNPTKEQKDIFTRILKGNIDLTICKFNKNTTGKKLDSLARKYLREKNYDYSHGTGHGVGNFLSVHEGPISISKKSQSTLKNGMLVTNEPGFYKTNDYGIRIENILLVVKKNNFLGFEVLTLAPIDKKLIDTKSLKLQHKIWINNYHKKVYKKIYKYLNNKENEWLKNKTSPI